MLSFPEYADFVHRGVNTGAFRYSAHMHILVQFQTAQPHIVQFLLICFIQLLGTTFVSHVLLHTIFCVHPHLKYTPEKVLCFSSSIGSLK